MFARRHAFALSLALLGAASDVSAQSRRREVGLGMEPFVGVTAGEVTGVAYGASLSVRYGWFQAGAVFAGGHGATAHLTLRAPSHTSIGVAAGLRIETPPRRHRLRVDVLLGFGVHRYRDMGAALADGPAPPGLYTDGVGAQLPFLGLRAGGVWEYGDAIRFALGGSVFAEADLNHVDQLQTVFPLGRTQTVHVGSHLLGIVLTAGLSV